MYRKILVGYDGSASSRKAFDTALELAAGLHWRLPWRLAKLFRQWQADIVHTHNDRPLLYAAPAARLTRVPRP